MTKFVRLTNVQTGTTIMLRKDKIVAIETIHGKHGCVYTNVTFREGGHGKLVQEAVEKVLEQIEDDIEDDSVLDPTDCSSIISPSEIMIQQISDLRPGVESALGMPDPTENDLKTHAFNIIWEAIKGWDIAVPGKYEGYTGATGNHVKAIYDALKKWVFSADKEAEPFDELL